MLSFRTALWMSWVPLISSLSHAATHQSYPDWIPKDNLCKGQYIEPNYPPLAAPQQTLPIHLSAQSSVLTENGLSILEGQVKFIQGHRQLNTQRAEYNRSKDEKIQTLSAKGHLIYTEPGIRFEGDDALYDFLTERFDIYHVNYRLYQRHARGTAQKASVDSNKQILLTKASYTTCAPLQEEWSLTAKEIHLDPDRGRGFSKHAMLNWHNTPILYLPYVDFPLTKKRKTGFLYPDFSSTTQSGFTFSVPYYVNLAPNYDWTITPGWLTLRGLNIGNELRYMTEQSTGNLNIALLPHDRHYRDFKRSKLRYHPEITDNNDPRLTHLRQKNNNRFAVTLNHRTQFDPQWLLAVDIDHVGDDDYFVDLGSGLNGANTSHLLKQADLSYMGTHWNTFFRVQEYETLHPFNGPKNTETYRRQPQWNFDADYPDIKGIDFKLLGEVVNFAHKRDPFNKSNNFSRGWRSVLTPSMAYPLNSRSAYLIPKIELDMTKYNLELSNTAIQRQDPSKPRRIVPLLSADTGVFFERNINFLNEAYVQTLEPRFFYLYVPNKKQSNLPNFDSGVVTFGYASLFRTNRFSGHDRIGDAHQLTWSLGSRLLESVQKEEKLKFSLSQILYFRSSEVTLADPNKKRLENPLYDEHYSPYIMQVYYQITPSWLTTVDLEWHHKSKAESLTYLLAYRHEKAIFNLSLQQQRIDPGQTDFSNLTQRGLVQSDISFIWPVTEKFNILGRWHYDYKENRAIDTLAGLEYSSCCSAIQLSATRYLRPSEGITERQYTKAIFLQVIFRGLSNFGYNSSDSKLSNRITGYEKFSKRQPD